MPISLARSTCRSPVDWTRLLTHQRAGEDAPAAFDRDRNPFHRDSDRILFSSAWRRLAAKAQVHAPTANEYCRNRLTHSLEVSALARNLGTTAGHVICRRFPTPDHIRPTDFGAIAAAAAAAHDLGMTPLGHAGEKLIRQFYSGSGAPLLAGATDLQRADLEYWDANAQTIRLLTRLSNATQPHGLRLTCATLAAVTKYPNGASPTGGKFNYFQDDAAAFRTVFETVGLPELAPNRWLRHPLAWIVESSDDTCFTCVDVEDSYHTGYLPYRDAVGLLASLTESRTIPNGGDPEQTLIDLRGLAINNIARAASAAFAHNLDDLLRGRIDPPHLLALTPLADAINEVQAVTRTRVFAPRDAQLTTQLERAYGATWLDHHGKSAGPGYQAALATTDAFSAMTDRSLSTLPARDRSLGLAALP